MKMCGLRESVFPASFITQLSIPKTSWYFVSVVTSGLLCTLLPPSQVLDNWEKCALTPQSWPVTLSGLGQGCDTSAPWSWTIWFEGKDFQSWVSGQWSALAFSSLFALMVSVCWESSKTWQRPTNKGSHCWGSFLPLGNAWCETEPFKMLVGLCWRKPFQTTSVVDITSH